MNSLSSLAQRLRSKPDKIWIRVPCPVLAFVLGLVLFASASGEAPLVLAVHPYLSLTELMQRYSPLADYLGEALGQPVVVRIGRNYQEHLAYIGKDKVDIAFMGPALYVKMVAAYGKKPLIARLEVNGNPMFQGKIIVRKNAPIDNLEALLGKRFAFGDPASTMSHLVPRFMLWQAGITAEKLADYQFLGSHANVALSVLAGDFDAGAVKEEVFYQFEAQGLKAIATTPLVSEHVFVTRSSLPLETIEAVKKALFRLRDTPEGQRILRGIKTTATGMAPARDTDYNNLRDMLRTFKRLDIYW